MCAVARGSRFAVLLVLVTFFLGLFAEDAEARRRGGGRGFRRGGAARVSARRGGGGRRRGGVRVAANRGGGGRARISRNRGFVRGNDGVVNVDGVAIDETGLGGFAGENFDRNQQLQQVVLNGRGLRIARDRNGNLFALQDNAVDVNGQLIVDPSVGIASTDPLTRLANGQVISGFDSRGRALNSGAVRDIQLFNSGGTK